MESEAVLADESRDAADRAASQVLRSARSSQVDGSDLDVEAIGLGDGLDGNGAGVALEGTELSATRLLGGIDCNQKNSLTSLAKRVPKAILTVYLS